MSQSTLYPLLTERRIVQPIWGGTRLAAWLDLPEPRPERIGETWQVYDSNPILNGFLAGQTLAQATATYGAALVGTRAVERYGLDFPLLAKFIDAAAPLSIQVHPDDDYAHKHEAATGFHGKTEAWYIIDAEPGASVVYGLERPSSRDELRAAVEDGSIETLLQRVPVQSGDVIFVPAGTMHAIDAGIMLFEIQQKSDLTYRVYDYGRRDARTGQPRELHVGKALDVTDFEPPSWGRIPAVAFDEHRDLMIACDSFALEGWTIETARNGLTDPGTFEILTVVEGMATLRAGDNEMALRRGDSVVLPASLGDYTLLPGQGSAGTRSLILRAYVPDLERDIVEPLKAKGLDAARIAASVAL
jgi:mannose-6-phosphate isomerase